MSEDNTASITSSVSGPSAAAAGLLWCCLCGREGLKEKIRADAMFPLQLEERQEVVWWLGSFEHAVHLVHRCALFMIPWASQLSWNLIASSWQMLWSNKLKTESNLTTFFSSPIEAPLFLAWFAGLPVWTGFGQFLLSVFKTSLSWFKMFSNLLFYKKKKSCFMSHCVA